MTGSNAAGLPGKEQARLPLRDWILLPLLSLLTISLMLGCTELIGWQMFPRPKSNLSNCLVRNDASRPMEGVPNSVCSEESFETGRVEYRFNECGYRAGMSCGPKPAGTYRIVVTGSSLAFGLHVEREKTFTALLPTELEQLTGRKVELFNQGMVLRFPRGVALSFDDVLAAKPDMILWPLSNRDIESASQLDVDPSSRPAEGFVSQAMEMAKSSRTRMLLQYYLNKSADPSVKLRMMAAASPYVKANLSAAMWRDLQEFETYYAVVEGHARAAGVPMVVVMLPGRTQAAMISMGRWPPDCDPYKLGDAMRTIVARHGGTYLDILPDFRSVPNADQHYFPIDGHPDAQGSAIISRILASKLAGGAVPGLQARARNPIDLKRGQ